MRVMLQWCKWGSLSSAVWGHPRGLDLVLTIRLHHDRESQGGVLVDHTQSFLFVLSSSLLCFPVFVLV